VVLAALALMLHLRAPTARAALQVDAGALSAARDTFEARRVRNALDAWRAGHGSWPQELEQLAEAGWVERSALTSSTGAPYYYRRGADGVVLLSPER
jgi:hypothetical protein